METQTTAVCDIASHAEDTFTDVDAEKEELAALLDVINDRWQKKEYPYVLPKEALKEQKNLAQETLDLVNVSECVEMQSFLDAEYAKFIKDNPQDEDPNNPFLGSLAGKQNSEATNYKTSAKGEQPTQEDENMKRVHKKFLCHPRDNIKLLWDIFASIVLVVACFMTPFGLAFESLD